MYDSSFNIHPITPFVKGSLNVLFILSGNAAIRFGIDFSVIRTYWVSAEEECIFILQTSL